MTNATIQGLMLDRAIFGDTQDMGNTYRQYDGIYTVFNTCLADSGSLAGMIWHEAQRFDTLTNAYDEHAARLAATLTGEPLAPDMEAALRQAELLGATADQRAKLRAIVTARFTAVQERNAMETALTEALRASRNWQTQATEEITDPSDKRVWQIFGNAAMESKKQGYCSVYDQISEAVGIPTRDTLDEAGYMQPTRWDVEVEVTITRRITVTVEADSFDAAIRAGDDMEHRDIWEYVSGEEWSYYDISETDAKDASEADE